jgi:hypothetical protein
MEFLLAVELVIVASGILRRQRAAVFFTGGRQRVSP